MNRIEVVLGIRSPYSDKLLTRRLHVARFINGSALKQGRRSAPLPCQAKACECLGEDWLVESCVLPVVAAACRDVDASYSAAAGPGETGNLVKALLVQNVAAGRIPAVSLDFEAK